MTAQTTTRTQFIRGSAKDEHSGKPRRRLLWLLILLIPVCLWFTSQIALIGLGANRAEDTVLSNMAADYSQWSLEQFKPLKPELIGTIRSDQLTLAAPSGVNVPGTIVPFIPFGTGTQIAEVPSDTPTATNTRVPVTRTATSTRTIVVLPPRTDTPVATATTVETATWTPVPPTSVPPTAVPPTSTLPMVQFYKRTDTISEGMGNVSTAVILSAISAQTVSVSFNTASGSATAPDDYTDTTTTLIFLPGQTIQIVDIPISDDTLVEGIETLFPTLLGPTNAALGANSQEILNIVDDDPEPASPCVGYTQPQHSLTDYWLSFADHISLEIGCGQSTIVDLGSTPIDTTSYDTAFDVVIYEREFTGTQYIEMDWVVVQVGTSSTGPWLTIFYWGDGGPDANTSLGQNGFAASEDDNLQIPRPPVNPSNPQLWTAPVPDFLTTGVAIDVDAVVPPNIYSWLRVFTPIGGANDTSEVDYIQIVP